MDFVDLGNGEVETQQDFATSLQVAKAALQKLGKISNEQEHFFEGVVKYGFQRVKVRVSWVKYPNKTKFIVQAQSDDIWNAGGKSARERLVGLIRNYNNQGYKIDRLGVHPFVLVAIAIGFVFVVSLVVVFVLNRLQ